MWYATLEIGKIRQRQIQQSVEAARSARFRTLKYLLVRLGRIMETIGRHLQARHQYGTTLHTG